MTDATTQMTFAEERKQLEIGTGKQEQEEATKGERQGKKDKMEADEFMRNEVYRE